MAKRGANVGRRAKAKPKEYKRETIAQSAERVVSEIEGDLRCFPPTILKDKGVQRARKELERKLKKVERVLRKYKRVSLFTSADFFADIIKTRRVNKSELTPLDMTVFQKAFREFQDNFPEFLHMVAALLDGKPLRSRASHYGYDSQIETAYDEAFNRCNSWYIEAIRKWRSLSPSKYSDITRKLLDTGVMPTFYEFLYIFRKRNPKLVIKRDGGLIPYPEERSLRRSLERLGLVTRADTRGRPKEK